MYLEKSNSLSSRLSWKFTYKGHELIQAAEGLVQELQAKIQVERNKMAAYMKDETRSIRSKLIDTAKNRLTAWAMELEQVQVLGHEFTRNPEREYTLSLGDVAYFGLVKGINRTDDAEDDE